MTPTSYEKKKKKFKTEGKETTSDDGNAEKNDLTYTGQACNCNSNIILLFEYTTSGFYLQGIKTQNRTGRKLGGSSRYARND